nr:hypothetical protein [Pseudomonas corrugata]
MEEDDATKVKNELFSIDPQNSPVKPQSDKPKNPQDWLQESTVYPAEVFPQYPFNSQIGVAVAQLSPAGGLLPHGGCEKLFSDSSNSSVSSKCFILADFSCS